MVIRGISEPFQDVSRHFKVLQKVSEELKGFTGSHVSFNAVSRLFQGLRAIQEVSDGSRLSGEFQGLQGSGR